MDAGILIRYLILKLDSSKERFTSFLVMRFNIHEFGFSSVEFLFLGFKHCLILDPDLDFIKINKFY